MPCTQFHAALNAWFNDRFQAPTDCQLEAWSAIESRLHTVIAAPTGSGKTLAAFLCAIDGLLRQGIRQGYLQDATQVLYVSPLKALSNDIQRNLQEPLQGMRDRLLESGLADVEIRAMVRTGDTLPGDREKMRRRPPHILVTTPESLYLLLTSDSGRAMLTTVHTVIVDEVHALAGNKRGAHLALSLQRLAALTERPFLRVGLSATQKPIDRVANFLIGNEREPRRVVDSGHHRERDLTLEIPGLPLAAVLSSEAWQDVYDRLSELIRSHRTTLIFVNTRRLAERVARHLAERLGEEAVTAHHGSLAREHRLQAEQRLKQGQLQALVATASLELGIDIGDIDLVCQIGSPRAIAALLQRVGRSGHGLAALPKGRLFPTTRDDLVECAALLEAVARGELEALVVPHQPLDVLAQQLVAEAAARDWSEADLLALVQGAWPYRDLEAKTFREVVEMLALGFATQRGRRGAHLHWDAVGRRLRGRRGARLIALTNGGAIPDQFDYDVVLEPEEQFIGTLNEDFAFESLPGDIFQLGNTSYRVLRVQRGTVRVEDARGLPPNIPFWFGEAPGRSDELSAAVSRLRTEFSQRWSDDRASLSPWLRELGLPGPAAEQLIEYLGTAHLALGLLPTQRQIVFERFFDETGDTHLVIHSPFGSRLNRAWGLALRKRFCRRFNFELQAAALEDSIVLSLSATHSFPLDEVRSYLNSNGAREVLVQALLDAPMFTTRWRWNASIALAVRRNRNGRRVAPQIQRMEAEDLVAAVFPDQLACLENIVGQREVPDHPLVNQTVDDCLNEAMDAAGLERLLRGIESGQISVATRELTLPSPLAQEILSARPYAFLDDAPAEERRTSAVQARSFLDPQTASELGRLDTDAIAEVSREAWPVVRDSDELHDALLTMAVMCGPEAQAAWTPWFEDLQACGRVVRIELAGGGRRWLAAERWPQWRKVHPSMPAAGGGEPVPCGMFAADDPDRSLQELARGRLQVCGPVSLDDLATVLCVSGPVMEQALLALEQQGYVMRGRFDGRDPKWCERGLLARINRYTVRRMRSEIEPVSSRDFMRFLLAWHGLTDEDLRQGEAALPEILAQLEGLALPLAAWEDAVLPARLVDFTPDMLDRLCFSGRLAWRPAGGQRAERQSSLKPATPIVLAPRTAIGVWAAPARAPEPGGDAARLILATLERHGALFFDELQRLLCVEMPGPVIDALRQLVSCGLVACDGLGGLRALGRRACDIADLQRAGRWDRAQHSEAGVADAPTEHMIRVLLRRYGVLMPKLLTRETGLPRWYELVRQLRRLEARGEVRGGRFVGGFSGEQFALPEAVALLRSVRKRPLTGQCVRLDSADPLNLLGIIVPGEPISPRARSTILFRDGIPVAVRTSGRVTFLTRLEDQAQWTVRNVLQADHSPRSRAAH